MRPKIVADDHTIINTQGIRFAEKVDATYSGMRTNYHLRVTYKGDKMDFRYEDVALRDAQFARLRAAMDSPPSVGAVDPVDGIVAPGPRA